MNAVQANTASQGDFFDPSDGYDFQRPLGQPTASEGSALLSSLIETAAFKRLKGVSFLGAIDYSLVRSPNGSRLATRHTREQHSLGVLKLALTYCECRGLPPRERRTICAAALLHDIGHPPFSHSMEAVLAEKFGIDHHSATQDIICGRIPLGREVLNALRSHNIDVECVAALVAGQMPDFDRFFSGPITFDTIEGISRSYQYLPHAGPSPRDVVIAAIARANNNDQQVVDAFWRRKHEVYYCVVHSWRGILADFASQEALRRHIHRVSKADCFGDDRLMFNRLPGLKEALTSTSMEREVVLRLGAPDSYVARKYFVDESGDFFSRKDDARYRYTKSPARTSEVRRSTLLSNEDAHTKQNEEIPFGGKRQSPKMH